jgi:hypothetical protein
VSRPNRLTDAPGEELTRGIEHAAKFFMGEADVQHALAKLVRTLEAQAIPYAIIGAMALNEHGYRRVTVDIDLLLTAQGLASFKQANLGLGYVERFPGSRGMRDTENGVDIDVVLAGTYPGDGQPKPVAFPDPAVAAERVAWMALLPLPKLLELKLASGMTAPHRLKDLADVQEIIHIQRLPRAFATALDPYVRDKFIELWEAVQGRPEEE